jgi:hypothetical protein
MGKDEHPVKISSSGGYFAFESAQQTPNTQIAVYEYADGKILEFEVRGVYTNAEADQNINVGNIFLGTKGWMSVNGSTWKTYFGRKNEPGPSSETQEEAADFMDIKGAGADSHFANFIDALRAGNREVLNCDIRVGYMSTVLPHLGNTSYRLGRQLRFDGHKERFIGDGEANKMLTRNYRKPYVVPRYV